MRELLNVTKALSDENRLRVLGALQGGELCVCQITALLKLAPSTVSKHMSILRQAGLVDSRKAGRWAFYRLRRRGVPAPVREALAWVQRALKDTEAAQRDGRALRRILKLDPEVLCRRQARS